MYTIIVGFRSLNEINISLRKMYFLHLIVTSLLMDIYETHVNRTWNSMHNNFENFVIEVRINYFYGISCRQLTGFKVKCQPLTQKQKKKLLSSYKENSQNTQMYLSSDSVFNVNIWNSFYVADILKLFYSVTITI